MLDLKRCACTEMGVHRPLGIWRNEDHTGPGRLSADGWGMQAHPECLHFVKIKVSQLVISDQTSIGDVPTELRDGNHGIGRRAAAGPMWRHCVAVVKHSVLLGRIDQLHATFVEAQLLQCPLCNLELHVN